MSSASSFAGDSIARPSSRDVRHGRVDYMRVPFDRRSVSSRCGNELSRQRSDSDGSELQLRFPDSPAALQEQLMTVASPTVPCPTGPAQASRCRSGRNCTIDGEIVHEAKRLRSRSCLPLDLNHANAISLATGYAFRTGIGVGSTRFERIPFGLLHMGHSDDESEDRRRTVRSFWVRAYWDSFHRTGGSEEMV